MRLKPVIAAASVVLLLGAVGCTKTESPKEVDASDTTVDKTDDTTAEPDCPTQLVVDTVNEEFDNLTAGKDADIEGAMETMGEYVPSEVQDDFETWQSAALEVVDLIDGIDPTSSPDKLTASQREDLDHAQDLMSDPDVDEAQQNVKDYFRDACPDLVFSEEADSTTTTAGDSGEAASGDCPTQDEVDEINAAAGDMDLSSPTDFASTIITMLAVMDTYLPSEYDSDLAVLQDAYTDFAASVVGIDPNDPTLTPEQQTTFENAYEALQSPEVTAAQQRTEDYFTENCPDIDFG